MALADFKPVREQISYNGRPLMEVRGLSLADLSILVRGHMDDMVKLFAIAQSSIKADPDNILTKLSQDGFMVKILSEAPMLGAHIIALGGDEPDMAEKALALPGPLQVNIINTIVQLTFEDVGGPKAFVALVRQLLPQGTLPPVGATNR